jgi:hypothetical protein
MTLRHTRWAAFLVAAGLAVAAAPAAATEGPPGAGPQLPEPLRPVTIQPAPPPVNVRVLRPRVMRARVVPRRIVAGHRSRLRITLATTGRVEIVIHRGGRGHRVRVYRRTVMARTLSLVVRLPAFRRAGRYRVTVVAVDAQGNRSHAVRRALRVVRR